jgi:hypothetical protein
MYIGDQMSVTVGWDNPEKTILLKVFISPWTWQELSEALATLEHEHCALQHQVVWLHDYSKTRFIPLGGLVHAQRMVRQLYPNTCRTIVVAGANRPVQSLGKVLVTLAANPFGVNALSVATLEEGRKRALELLKVEPSN